MAPVVVVVEQDQREATLWRYGLAGPDGALQQPRRFGYDPLAGCGGAVDPPDANYPRAVLLVRAARGGQRLVWDATTSMFPEDSHRHAEPSLRPSGGPWPRSAVGKAKARREALRGRADRADGEPRAAA